MIVPSAIASSTKGTIVTPANFVAHNCRSVSFAKDLTASQVRLIQAYVLDQAPRESRAPSVRP